MCQERNPKDLQGVKGMFYIKFELVKLWDEPHS